MMSRVLVNCGRVVGRQARFSAALPMARAAFVRECRPPVSAFYSTKTKGDLELSNFLAEEIAAEKKARKHDAAPKIEGFDAECHGSEVKLVRKFNEETITVQFNVNHSVDAEEAPPTQPGESDVGEMLSKPNFDVTIERANQKIVLSCTFTTDHTGDQDGYDDLFQIVEFSIHSGTELQDADYSVSGDIMDAHLYDLLMNLLEERGITNEFAEQLVDFSTSYEHSLYIGLLEKLKDFVSK